MHALATVLEDLWFIYTEISISRGFHGILAARKSSKLLLLLLTFYFFCSLLCMKECSSLSLG